MPAVAEIEIRVDDLSGRATQDLLRFHLEHMRDSSPAESCHAMGLDGLQRPGVTVWTAWIDDDLAGAGALARLDGTRGEIKSMRVYDRFRGRGVGRAILRRIVTEAPRSGIESLWLETGSADLFLPAVRLYESEGFQRCPPFGYYTEDPNSMFLTRLL